MGTKPDKNLFSFTGDENGNIWLNGLILFWDHDYDGTVREYTLDLNNVSVPDDIADTLKFSGVRDFTLTVKGEVPGGYEDCIDVNNVCKNVTVFVEKLCPRGRYCATIKGGSENIKIVGIMVQHGEATDVSLGEHSDQSMMPTTKVHLGITPIDGRKVDYWQFNADKPIFIEGTGPYKGEIIMPRWFRSTFANIVVWLKKFLPI